MLCAAEKGAHKYTLTVNCCILASLLASFTKFPDPRLMNSAMTLQVVTLLSSEDLLELSDLHVLLPIKKDSHWVQASGTESHTSFTTNRCST